MEPLPFRLSLDAGMDAFSDAREQGAMRAVELWTRPREFLGEGDFADDKTEGGLECVRWEAIVGLFRDDSDELMAPWEKSEEARDGGLISIVDDVSILRGLVSDDPFVLAVGKLRSVWPASLFRGENRAMSFVFG